MKFNHLTHRTGLARGVAVNGAGDSLTDSDGAGNFEVGSYYLDFSGIPAIDGTPNQKLIDNEFSWVIADARTLEDGDNLDPEDIFLLDTDTPTELDGTVVDDDTRRLTITSISADLRFVGPSYQDAGTWTIDEETGEVGFGLGTSVFNATLQDLLDAQITALEEVDDEVDLWTEYTAHLRWSLHWALMVIDCVAVQDEGIAEFATNNGVVPYASAPVPVGGPQGILFNYGTSTSGDNIAGLPGLRLWSPLEGSQGVRIVQRGERELAYHYRRPRNIAHPSANVDNDIDMGEGVSTDTPFLVDDASTRVEGANIHLNLRLNRTIKVRDDQLVVLCVQSGRARLLRGPVDGTQQIIIAGPEELEGRGGPIFRLYHHAIRVLGTRS